MTSLFPSRLTKLLTQGWLILIATTPLQAQPLLTLEEVVQTVLKNNFAIQVARNKQKIAAKNHHIGKAGFLPQLDMHLGGQANRQVWPQVVDHTSLSAGFRLTWNIFRGMHSIFTYQHLGKERQISQLQTQQTMEEKVAAAIKGYYSLVLAQQEKHVLESALAVSKEVLQLAQAKYEVGECTQLAYLTAQVQYNDAQAKLLAQEEAITAAKLTLRSLLGRDGPEEFTTVEAIPLPQPLPWEALWEAFTAANPSILVAQKRCEEAALALKLQQANLWPCIDFSLGYSLGSQYQAQTWQATPRAFQYGIGISFNLFHAFQHATAIQEAQIKADNAQLERAAQQVQLAAALKQHFLHYTQQLQCYALFQQHVQVGQENAKVALAQYRLGSITLLALDKARQSAQEATLKCLQTIYEAKVTEVELQRLGGGLLDSYE